MQWGGDGGLGDWMEVWYLHLRKFIFHVPDIVRWGSVLFDLFNRALYEHHGIQKIWSSWSFTFEKKSLFDKFLLGGHKELVNGHKTNWYFEEIDTFEELGLNKRFNPPDFSSCCVVRVSNQNISGWLCDDGGFRWALPCRTHGDDRLRGGNDWGMRLPPTDRILGSDKVTRSIGKGSDIFPWSKKWFKSHRKSTGKGCCVAWRMCQFANLPRMTNTVKVTYVGWPLCCLFT